MTDIDILVTLSHDDLISELADVLLDDGLGFGAEDPAARARFVERWLGARREQLRHALCSKPLVAALLDAETGELARNAAAIADFVSVAVGRPPANTVAVILVKQGLASLCCENTPSDPRRYG